MITITKNGKTTKVTKAAFENFYKGAGWVEKDSDVISVEIDNKRVEKVKEVRQQEIVEDLDSDEEDNSDEDWEAAMQEDDVEKPLSEMNNHELKEKAESMGIDVSGLKSNKELREAIRANS